MLLRHAALLITRCCRYFLRRFAGATLMSVSLLILLAAATLP